MKALALVGAAALVVAVYTVSADDVGTEFTYQGRLLQDDAPVNGLVELDFDLFDAPTKGARIGFCSEEVQVVDGLFTVELDYGAEMLAGPRWLEVSVDEGDPLAPRHRLAPAPFAIQTRGLFVYQDRRVAIERASGPATLELTAGILTTRLQQEDAGDFTLRMAQKGGVRVLTNNGETMLRLQGDGAVLIGPGAGLSALVNIASEGSGVDISSITGCGLVVETQSNQNILEARSANGRFEFGVSEEQTFVNNDLTIAGMLSKAAGSFIIDHPVDPANRYLSHSFVESPDMMNIYNGNVTTDEDGIAVVDLPNYFEALNRDYRYQLTVIGSFARAMIAKEIVDERFVIRTDEPGVKVSWQVTGVRHDPYAEQHRIAVESDKPPALRGRYLHPREHGVADDLAEYGHRPAPSFAETRQ